MSTFALCADAARRWLPEFVGGDLDAARSAAVRSHLVACSACRREAAALQQSLKALRGGGRDLVAGVDEAMFATLHADVCAAVAAERLPASPGSHRWLWFGTLAAASFLLGWLTMVETRPQALVREPIFRVSDGSMSDGRGDPGRSKHRGDLQPFRTATPAVLHPLGYPGGAEDDVLRGGRGAGVGMMGRLRLRTLENALPIDDWRVCDRQVGELPSATAAAEVHPPADGRSPAELWATALGWPAGEICPVEPYDADSLRVTRPGTAGRGPF